MAVPSDGQGRSNKTEKFLWDRMRSVVEQIGRQGEKDSYLVIELYNIDESAVVSINNFLMTVNIFKTYTYHNERAKLPKDLPIYIELANISPPLQKKKPKKHAQRPLQVQQLSFLRELDKLDTGEKGEEKLRDSYMPQVPHFDASRVKIDRNDKELCYILRHLRDL
jgi:hypothetical protein